LPHLPGDDFEADSEVVPEPNAIRCRKRHIDIGAERTQTADDCIAIRLVRSGSADSSPVP
jgi:hypothetical protein